MKILFVAGTFDNNGGKPSGLAKKIYDVLAENNTVIFHNGGNYDFLSNVIADLETAPTYDSIWWFANVPNDLPKLKSIKEIQPYTMLVTSKRNNNEYSDMEVIQRALAQKANLLFEFSKAETQFKMRVLDPLGCVWANTFGVRKAVTSAMDRLTYLKNITRQQTTKSDISNGLVLSWYFDSFKLPEHESDKVITVPDQSDFISLVHDYAEIMQTKIMPMKDTARFLGNASLKLPPQVGRCGKTMPSFLHNNMVFVSRRNVPKQFIEMDDFVPVYMQDDKLYYCGDNKPSVDAPVQIRLYAGLPNIRYMIHFHSYILNAPFTSKAIPCGAVDEVEEVFKLIDEKYQSRELDNYAVNLKGHGAIIMADTIDKLKNYTLIKRAMPEDMT